MVVVGPQKPADVPGQVSAVRGTLRLASTRQLFLGGGDRGSRVSRSAGGAVGTGAEQAGVEGFHVHRMRHSFASRWLASGGTEDNLIRRPLRSSHREIVEPLHPPYRF